MGGSNAAVTRMGGVSFKPRSSHQDCGCIAGVYKQPVTALRSRAVDLNRPLRAPGEVRVRSLRWVMDVWRSEVQLLGIGSCKTWSQPITTPVTSRGLREYLPKASTCEYHVLLVSIGKIHGLGYSLILIIFLRRDFVLSMAKAMPLLVHFSSILGWIQPPQHCQLQT